MSTKKFGIDITSLCAQMILHAFYNTRLTYAETEKALLLFFTQDEIDKANAASEELENE